MRRLRLVLGALLVLPAAPAFAQDTIPRDTLRVPIPPGQLPADTFINNAARDSARADSLLLLPAPNLPELIRPAAGGWWESVYEWNEAELSRFNGLTLLDLLERVPGLIATRTGGYGRPAGLSAFGRGGGRLRVFRDGIELDALSAADLDIQLLPLAAIAGVRVERRLTETQIYLTSFTLPDRRPFSYIEAATGDPDVRFLRGVFARTFGETVTFLGGVDVADTDGFGRNQNFGINSLFTRLTWLLTPRIGLSGHYRQTTIDRFGSPFVEVATRREARVQALLQPSPGFAVEGWAGMGWRKAEEGDSLGADLRSGQAGARIGIEGARAGLEATARARWGEGGYAGPGLLATVRGDLRPAERLSATGIARLFSVDGVSGTELEGGVRLGLVGGLSVFGSAAIGERPVAFLGDTLVQIPGVRLRVQNLQLRLEPAPVSSRVLTFPVVTSGSTALRAGAEWRGGSAGLGAAAIASGESTWLPFSAAFDTIDTIRPVAAASGIEAYGFARIPVLPLPLLRRARLGAWYTEWLETGGRPFLPTREGRAALEFHEVYREGNFEPTLRLELVHRGSSIGPTGVAANAYTLASAFLQLRIINVRIFVTAGNVLAERDAADVPGFRLPPIPYFIYGVRWFFQN